MSKKVYIVENNLLKLKRFMTGEEKTSHKPFIDATKKDKYIIGGEGGNNDFFHIDEGYTFSKLANIDLSEVGEVHYEWYFDEEEYNEWLNDNELVDCDESRNRYYKEEITYDVSYYDYETYHFMLSDSVFYDDLEELFGEEMAEKILRNCIENGEGKFETYELYSNQSIDINNRYELNDMAMKMIPHGEYFKGCRGFILTNGVVVYTEGEHNEITAIPGIDDKFQFIELGNIRIMPNSIDIGAEPTYEQEEVLKQMLRCYDGEEIYLDILHDGSTIGASYQRSNYRYVLGEIDRFYSEGIKPQGDNGLYENKIINESNTFDEWFGGSVLKDKNGQPIKMYHGTDASFNEFSKDFIGKTGAYEGYGFNFTPYESRAIGYGSKNVIEAYLRAEKPLKSNENKISLRQLIKIIAEIDKGNPYTDTVVAAYEPSGYGEKWDENYYRRALPVAAKKLYEYNAESGYGDAGLYADICLSGNADKIKVIEVFEKLGYDSAIFYDNEGRLMTVIVFEPNQIKRTSNKTFTNDSNVMDENLETEVEASEVKLDSFKKNNELEPKIWNHFKLNSKVRLKLLDIADDFWEYANISWVKRNNICLTGSICNFNWSKYSDIDLHIIVDFSKIDEKTEFVQEYFNSKKNEWNEEHSNLKIYGYPVEIYVEDINAETMSNGIYDLEKNCWIKKPNINNIKEIGLDKYEIKNKSAKLMTLIDDLSDSANSTDDNAKLREIGNKAHKLFDKIKRMRRFGLARGGESDSLNITYKVLRRNGYIEKLWTISSELYDKINSIGIDEAKKIATKIIAKQLNEEVVADGNSEHNPFKKRWKYEREALKRYLVNYGIIMTSKENGKQYKVFYDADLSNRLGINYCICIQWNPMTMEPGNVIYVRAFDKFTRRIFKPEFDTRGFDNVAGTSDDVTA